MTILLIETAQGDVVGVRFTSAEDARDWADEHAEGSDRGSIRVVSKRDAVKLV